MESPDNINNVQEILLIAEERWERAVRALKRKDSDHAGGLTAMLPTHVLDRFSPGKGTFEVVMLAALINILKEQAIRDPQAITQECEYVKLVDTQIKK
jgi:hypothetical protein